MASATSATFTDFSRFHCTAYSSPGGEHSTRYTLYRSTGAESARVAGSESLRNRSSQTAKHFRRAISTSTQSAAGPSASAAKSLRP